jgi:hypothetical protein
MIKNKQHNIHPGKQVSNHEDGTIYVSKSRPVEQHLPKLVIFALHGIQLITVGETCSISIKFVNK